ncbi:FAD/NAD(P)-binding domain-containing protein [Phlegmacium glaucopus]|nr:FAD/NAD(P)-binding domain-containing protein [Phlegmacium glaucopus]
MIHDFSLGQFSVDQARPIKVIVIGAGYSGIVAGVRFRQRVQNLDLTIYDSNAGVGGTWFANKYPGLRCDIPSHSYQVTFEDNANWSAFYSSGSEIRQNLEHIVDKYMLRPYIKLQHRLVSARYSEESGKWLLTIKRPRSNIGESLERNLPKLNKPSYDDWEEFQDSADVLFTGVGALSRWEWPAIEGLENFAGKVIHSAQWETGNDARSWEESVIDWGDKNVGVIGVGSSAIQIVPSLQPRVKRLINYVRGKTWISSNFARASLLELSAGEEVDNYKYSERDLEMFKDMEYLRGFRRALEKDLNAAHQATILGSSLEATARAAFKEFMVKTLSNLKKPWIADHLIPDFPICCRRLTPGPGYLEALCEANVDFIPSLIKRVTPTGIETVDGKFEELDIIICATGFETSFKLDFEIIGRGGINLNDHQTPHPRTYLSIAVDGFPNMFQALGPNAGAGAGNLLLIMERQVDYAVAATLKLQRERLKSIEVKREAVEEFEKYIDNYFPTTVFGTKCRSWYKGGKEEGRVTGLWPGSPMHAARALEYPRWEDFNYEQLDNAQNRFYWLGDGNTVADRDPKADRAWYLKTENIDYPPGWWYTLQF